jgi:hypothetical protein
MSAIDTFKIIRSLAAFARQVLIRLGAVAWTLLTRLGSVFLALILLFEEWGWKPLSDLLAALSRFRIVARLEAAITALPPYAALVVFVLPTTILFPLKLVALWLLAKGQALAAGALFIGAKIASTALIARIFVLTQPALMRLQWFARAYSWIMPWKERLFAAIRASWAWRYGRVIKAWVKREAKAAWSKLQPRLAALRTTLKARFDLLKRKLSGKSGA